MSRKFLEKRSTIRSLKVSANFSLPKLFYIHGWMGLSGHTGGTSNPNFWCWDHDALIYGISNTTFDLSYLEELGYDHNYDVINFSTILPTSNDCFAASASVDTTPMILVFNPSKSRAWMRPQIPEPQPIGTKTSSS